MAIYQDKKTKKWGFRVYVASDLSGEKKQIQRTGFNTKAEAQTREAEFIAFKQYELQPKTTSTLFKEAYKEYKAVKKRELKETTFINHFYIIEKHIYQFFINVGVTTIKQINKDTANAFYEYLELQDYSITHKNKILRNFKQMIEYFNIVYKLDISFIVNLPRFKDTRPIKPKKETYTDKDIKKLIDSADTLQERVIIKLLYFGALRLSELRALTFNDIDYTNKNIYINKAVSSKVKKGTFKIYTPKSRAGTRYAYLPNHVINDLIELRDTLQAIKTEQVGQLYIIGGHAPLGETTIRRTLQKISEKASLKYLPPHSFRHSYITNMIVSGKVDLKALTKQVGHESFKTTLDIYTHLTRDKQQDAINEALTRLNNDF